MRTALGHLLLAASCFPQRADPDRLAGRLSTSVPGPRAIRNTLRRTRSPVGCLLHARSRRDISSEYKLSHIVGREAIHRDDTTCSLLHLCQSREVGGGQKPRLSRLGGVFMRASSVCADVRHK